MSAGAPRDRFTFLHAADVHLDSPLRGLERYEGAPAAAIRGATRRLRLPGNVHPFATDAPHSFAVEGLGVVVHGQGFARRDVTRTALSRFGGAS